jgi:integrase
MFLRSGPATLGELAREYAGIRPCRTNSLEQYRIVADLYERWAGGPVALHALDERSVQTFLADYATTARPSTVRSKRAHLLALWRAAADEGWCEPPVRRVRVARSPRPVVEAWTHDEVQQLLHACRRLQRRHRCGLPRWQWWDLAVRVAWDSGLRWGDLVALPAAAVRPDGVASWTQSKTGRPVTFRLSETSLEALHASLEACPRVLVCPWPASHETFAQQVRVLVRHAGIRPGTWKWLRRASATDVELQQHGAGASHLGHAPGSRVAELSYLAPAILGRRLACPHPLAAVEMEEVGGGGGGGGNPPGK